MRRGVSEISLNLKLGGETRAPHSRMRPLSWRGSVLTEKNHVQAPRGAACTLCQHLSRLCFRALPSSFTPHPGRLGQTHFWIDQMNGPQARQVTGTRATCSSSEMMP